MMSQFRQRERLGLATANFPPGDAGHDTWSSERHSSAAMDVLYPTSEQD
jgi:hypothetical protein